MKILLQRNKDEVFIFMRSMIHICKKIIEYYELFNDVLNSLIEDKAKHSQQSSYFSKPLSTHAKELLFSLVATFPTPRSSPDREASPLPYAPLFSQDFKSLQEFRNHMDNYNTQTHEEMIWSSPYIDPTIIEKEEDISSEQI
ncbi:unnamed protein product [Rhizophagus irregularis]|nr:unnamed protein product [Rhizophagus irregularis]